ncbi:hypothetical protein DFH08DRAFT_997525 [Mycena albidolilacea]|uniref:Uncharacterized protein n=1 Tax=Mycena albidolilacea TaxID=1033008 RepID=A0AAD7ESV7_9AGAR|nr:hypothetical protein DFH08DRAFT_997525 [Mycena albidolilacea]
MFWVIPDDPRACAHALVAPAVAGRQPSASSADHYVLSGGVFYEAQRHLDFNLLVRPSAYPAPVETAETAGTQLGEAQEGFFVRFLGSTFGAILSPGQSRRRSRTLPIFGPAAARYSSGRCSHTAPLLAHLADYTPATDPAAARCPHTTCPRAPRCRSITSTVGCIPFACAPPLPSLAVPRPAAAHVCHCPSIAPSLHAPSRLHAYLTAACAHLLAAAQGMRTPQPLHPYPAAAYAPSPPLLAHPALLLLSAGCVPCRRSIARRRCIRTPPQPVLPAAARTPAAGLFRCCPSCTPPLPACSMCTSLTTYPTATCTLSMPSRPAVAHWHSRRTACAVPTSSDARDLVGMREGSDETQDNEQWQ